MPRNAFIAGIRELSGAPNPRVNQELASAREEAVTEMMRAARRKGANAVIGMRFDNREITSGWAEICAYGTAVRVEPAARVVATVRPGPRGPGTSVQPGTPA
jgi:uncharacterized protein YbjQ (UPF0145 family)